MRTCATWIVLPSILALCSTAPAQLKRPAAIAKAPTSIYGRNLLKNGNLEIETSDDKNVPGWAPVEGLSAVKYGSVGGEWDWGLSGCGSCGTRYARLAFEGSVHELSTSQTLDVAPAAEKIDAGKATARISAYLGGFLNSDTTSTIAVSFQDDSGKELGTLATDPVDTLQLPKAEKGSTGLTLCEKSGSVPAGTRRIVFTWHATATGSSGDYLALGDNFSLFLTEMP